MLMLVFMADDQFGAAQNSVEQQIGQKYNQQYGQQDAGSSSSESKDRQPEYAQIAAIISDLDRRLRTLEERYSNLRKKLQLTDENLLDAERSFSKELKSFNDESLELKKQVNDFSEKIGMLGSEMGGVAQKSDLKVLEKYLDMWNPTNFVTRKELKEYLKSKGILNNSVDQQENQQEDQQ